MIELILSQLQKVQNKGNGFMACCPAHDDKNPSLSLMQLPDGRILMKCFAGCDVLEVLGALGLSVSDLFPEGSLRHYKSFATMEKAVQERKNEPLEREKTILALAEEDRRNGKRLSPADMERERQAYMKVRKSECIKS